MAEMWISMGPQHPMTHGLWTLKVKVDGETVVDTEPDLGYIHRGVEKICESRDFTQITTYCDRLCYASANTWSHAYIYAAEDLLEVEVPERAEYIRLIAVELQRIASHLMWLGAYGPDIGNLSIMVWCLREREMMMDLLQELGGSRMHYNFPRIGGVKRDLPYGFAQRARAKLDLFKQRIQEYESLFDESTVFLVRTQGVGYTKAEEMVNHGVTGPNVRAAGVDYDVRWAHPIRYIPNLIGLQPLRGPRSKARIATIDTESGSPRWSSLPTWYLKHLKECPAVPRLTTSQGIQPSSPKRHRGHPREHSAPTILRIAGGNQCSTLLEGETDAARIHTGCPSGLQCS